jgi:hypothetical protein
MKFSDLLTEAAGTKFKSAESKWNKKFTTSEQVISYLSGQCEDGLRLFVHEIPTGTSKDVQIYKGFANSPGVNDVKSLARKQWEKSKAGVVKKIQEALDGHTSKFSFLLHDNEMKANRMGVTWYMDDFVVVEY